MKHPLEFIPSANRKGIFFLALIWTAVLFANFRPLDEPLKNPASPNGIVSFELAGTPTKTQAMIDSWDARTREIAAFGLGIDYLFMPVYAIALSLGVLLAAGRHLGWFAQTGAWLGWGAFAAATFDAVENLGLYQSLINGVTFWPQVSAFCATIKFALIIFGLVYAIVGGILPKRRPELVEGSK